MHLSKHLRRHAAFAAGIAATGALVGVGSAPAFADTQVYSSGAALQGQLQSILIPDSGISPAPVFTTTTSGDGFAEFGNTSGKLDLTQDPTADKLTTPELDAYVATDSAPNSTELGDATSASGSSSANEVTVPVAQTPLDVLLSLPASTSISLNSSQQIDLTNQLVSELYAGESPAAGGYSENTWGAFLTDAGLSKITSGSPSVGQFLDNGGGTTKISIEVRKNGAGTTLNLKKYLFTLDSSAYLNSGPWASPILDDANAYGTDEWPNGPGIFADASPGNSTDAAEALAVWDTAATVGYATAGDAASQGFTDVPTTGGNSQQVLYAEIQDNGVSATPVYANPENNATSPVSANVFTGDVNINGADPSEPGSWSEPGGPAWTGSWSATQASDPNVYGKASDVGYYPIVAVAFDLSWHSFTATNLAAEANYTSDAAGTTKQFLEFATGATGQGDIQKSGSSYYSELPTNIQTDAADAAAKV
jgi:hypothetical protein